MRLVSGQYNKGMKVLQVSTGKQIKIANAVTFMSRERSSAEVAYAELFNVFVTAWYPACCGNVNGFKLTINPVFVFQTVGDQLSEEGATQVFRPIINHSQILGAVGILQFQLHTCYCTKLP
jgi:peptide chain release factor 3